MTEEQQAVRCISRADRAKELLSNELYLEAIMKIKGDLYLEFESSKLEDTNERRHVWQQMQLLKKFEQKFERIVKQGARAKDTLSLLQRAKNLVM